MPHAFFHIFVVIYALKRVNWENCHVSINVTPSGNIVWFQGPGELETLPKVQLNSPVGWVLRQITALANTSCAKMKHCQRHNGPEGWVHLIKVTSWGNIASSNTNLIKFIFRISTKHQLLSQTSASPINLEFKILTKPSFRISTKIQLHNLYKRSAVKCWTNSSFKTSATVTTLTSFELASSLDRFTSIKFTKRYGASELVSDKHSQWSDSGPIKMYPSCQLSPIDCKWLSLTWTATTSTTIEEPSSTVLCHTNQVSTISLREMVS